jgi:DNA-binding CsgD family transcriptional regulator
MSETLEFLTDKEYTAATKKIIKHFTRRSRRLSQILIKDAEIFHNIKFKIMKADWRWKPDGGRTRYSWRNQCGIWAIQEAIEEVKQKYEDLKTADLSLNYCKKSDSYNETKLSDRLSSKVPDPSFAMSQSETTLKLRKEINGLIKAANLTEIEIEYLNLWAEGQTYQEIAKRFEIKNQSVSSVVKKALQKMRKVNV